MDPSPLPSDAPEVWHPVRKAALGVVRPLQRFLHLEAASGFVLLAAALVALVWVNFIDAASYEHLWHTPVVLGIGGRTFTRSLHFWVNEGLMAVFFFVVGLEIRREIHRGELSDLRRAALPIMAAIGGMVVPAAIYVAINRAPPARSGWGVPMATDIAFAVGVLALLGKRVPAALRVLLLALAIIDDIGAILVIALFYASGFDVTGLLIAGVGVGVVQLVQRMGVRSPAAYIAPGAVVWSGLLIAGIHPTLAGVILGLLTPARAWFDDEGLLAVGVRALDALRARIRGHAHAARAADEQLAALRRVQREVVSPVDRLQEALHAWVAFGIMPLFALANAGVVVRADALRSGGAVGIAAGVIAGLVVGKPVGVLLASALAVRLRIAALPRGVNWRGMLVVGMVAGIGFTMALFITDLAFRQPGAVAAAKLAVLVASGVSAGLALVVGRVLLPTAQSADVEAVTPDDAEASTEY